MKALYFLLLLLPSLAFGYSTGLRFPTNWKSQAPFVKPFSATPLPEHFDWREQVKPEVFPEIKNQGACGSCWAHAIVEALEWQVAIHDSKKAVLSPQEPVSCDKTQYACSGGFFTSLNYLVKPGNTYEADFPYTGKNSRCKGNVPHDYSLREWHYIGEANRVPSVDEIKNAIYTSGPVPVDVFANGRFQAYKTGVFTGPVYNGTNHMVLLVGWDNAGGYWIMQNSWGKTWGEKGYMRLKFAANGIARVAANVLYVP